jgi:hypothetical protein
MDTDVKPAKEHAEMPRESRKKEMKMRANRKGRRNLRPKPAILMKSHFAVTVHGSRSRRSASARQGPGT